MTTPKLISHTFDKSAEAWHTYDYHWSMVAKRENIFILATHQKAGGVNGGGYIWTDESRWSTDSPEEPVSILALLNYSSWLGHDNLDLRNAVVSVYLRGDGLALDNAKCYFWAHVSGTRWHYTSHPLSISHGRWADNPNVFALSPDKAKWHNSWARDPARATPLESTLAKCESFGFSFVGFKSEPTGKFSMDEFALQLR
ncbi:MAG: hypothetical protein FJ319_02180 [SAR202 cluster bacterium]|nr:hypothetical protein [SAR202 cluster bacterium]